MTTFEAAAAVAVTRIAEYTAADLELTAAEVQYNRSIIATMRRATRVALNEGRSTTAYAAVAAVAADRITLYQALTAARVNMLRNNAVNAALLTTAVEHATYRGITGRPPFVTGMQIDDDAARWLIDYEASYCRDYYANYTRCAATAAQTFAQATSSIDRRLAATEADYYTAIAAAYRRAAEAIGTLKI